MGKTNYHAANQRPVLTCIFPEPHGSSTEDRGLWLRDWPKTERQSSNLLNIFPVVSNLHTPSQFLFKIPNYQERVVEINLACQYKVLKSQTRTPVHFTCRICLPDVVNGGWTLVMKLNRDKVNISIQL